MRVYWTTLGEGGGRITLPSLVAPAIGHLFLIIEGRVRRVGHFIKKTTCEQNYNEKECSCVEVLVPYLSPTYIYLKSDAKMSSFSVCVFIE